MINMKLIIVGKGASGKDWMQKRIIEKGYASMKQYTTRKKRDNELGDEYHFIDNVEFKDMEKSDKFVSVNFYRIGWYGISLDELKSCDVAILSPANIIEIFSAYPELRKEYKIVYLDIPIDIRRHRLSRRYVNNIGDDNEVRIMNDENDFKDFCDYDVKLCSEDEVCDFINTITPKLK